MSAKQHRGGPRSVAPALGTTGGSPTRRLRTTPRSRTVMVGGVALGLASAALAGMPAQAINSDPPTGPGTIEIFPKRDMVAIEGYGEFAGKTAEIKVLRGGTVIGSARGTVDGTGFLEVNHPGGVCWGAGTNVQVTPDIKGGDKIRVDFLGTPAAGAVPNQWDGATTSDVAITDVIRENTGNKLIFEGTFGADVDMPGADLVADPGKFGVEIVNPDMRGGTSAVGARAIGWPLEPDPTEPPPTGYTVTGGIVSGAEGQGGTFRVTFAFDQASDLDLAEAGEAVALGWRSEAPPELGIEAFYDMTLYEFHEASGPGMGGCPAGPQEQRPNAPTTYTGTGAGPGRIAVTWGAGSTAPEAPAITGYEVVAVRSVSTGLDAGGVVRTAADGRSATVEGLTAGEVYSVEVATRSESGDSKPAVMRVRADAHITPAATATTIRVPNAEGKYLPLVTNVNGDFGVHLDPVLGLVDAEVHYTVDGTNPTLKSPTFVPGESKSLQITRDTTVRWIVVDGGNIVGPMGSKFFDIVESDAATKPAPVIKSAVAAVTNGVTVSGAVDVTFEKLGADVSAYRVQAYTGDSVDAATGVRVGTPFSVLQPTDTTITEVLRRITGLTNGTPYKFSVAARYGTLWSVESALSPAVAPEAAPAANAGPDQSVLRGREFVIDGGNSSKATSYVWTQIRPITSNNGGFPQDPALDLNPRLAGTQSVSVGANETSEAAEAARLEPTLTLRVPLLTTPTSDHNLLFRLATTHERTDGTTFVKYDTVEIKAQADTVVADEVRWRAGDEISGTGSQDGATLTLLNGSATGPQITQAVVGGGEWFVTAGTPALADGSKIYVWSDYGFTGTITVTD